MSKATVAKNLRTLRNNLNALYLVLGEAFPLADALAESLHRDQLIISVKVTIERDKVVYTVVFEKEGYITLNFTVADELLWFLVKRTNMVLFGVANPTLARFDGLKGAVVNPEVEIV